MTAAEIKRLKPGEVVECNIRGYHFLATYEGPGECGARIQPLHHNLTYYHATSRQVLRKIKDPEQWLPPAGADFREQFKPRRPRLA